MKKKNLKEKLKSSYIYGLLHKIKNHKELKLEKYYCYFQSNLIEGNIVAKIKNIPGAYEFDLRSDILTRIAITKEYEPEIVDSILKNINPKADAINIGANVGIYANLLAFNIANDNKVLAVEPTSNAYNLLKKNIKRNGNEQKIITFKGIITDKSGNFSINTVVGKEEYSSIGNLVHNSIAENKFVKEDIKGVTLDEILSVHNLNPKLLVIDVEGAEYKVFKGAEKTLKKFRPVIISELDDTLLEVQNTNCKEVIGFLEKLNYKVSDIDGQKIIFPFAGNILAKPL
ncbi:MAG: FkbM family methyltransferase [Polaribacter sp.]